MANHMQLAVRDTSSSIPFTGANNGVGMMMVQLDHTTNNSNGNDEMVEIPKTPTRPSHRIPDSTGLCPPAPRKPKSRPIRKRKSADGCTRLLDFSQEIESMYPSFLQVNLGRKIKKARSI